LSSSPPSSFGGTFGGTSASGGDADAFRFFHFQTNKDATPARSAPVRDMINQSPNEEGFASAVLK
jgi:hypothetical protein